MKIDLFRINVEHSFKELKRYYELLEKHSDAAKHSEFEKVPSKILSIIACVIGIIWSVIGFFAVCFGGALVATGQRLGEDTNNAEHTMEATVAIMVKLVGAFGVIVLGMVFSAVGNAKNAGSTKTIVNGALLLVAGVLATVWHSYVSGPMYVLWISEFDRWRSCQRKSIQGTDYDSLTHSTFPFELSFNSTIICCTWRGG